jgi:colicin import membrane protein
MWQAIRNHPRAVLGAILAHLVFIAILVVSFRFSEAPVGNFGEPPEVIEAVAVDEKVIQAELDKLKAAEQRKKDEARKAREAKLKEQRRKEELKKQKAAAAKKLKEQKAAEKKRLAELEAKRKQEAERKRKEQDRQARLEQERKAKEKQQALQAEIARQEAELQKQLEADRHARQAEARRQASLSEINKYRSLIKEEVTRHWNIPATAHDDLLCEVKVRLIPSGDVVEVKVIKSSGDAAFDRSVEKAVYRAAPLSVPPVESGLFDEFREVVFQFEPRNRV